MGIFNLKKQKKQPETFTLAQAMAMVAKNQELEPVPLTSDLINGPYTVVKATDRQAEIDAARAEVRKNSNFKERKEEFIQGITGDGEYKRIPYDISVSHSDRPGRVVRDYTL